MISDMKEIHIDDQLTPHLETWSNFSQFNIIASLNINMVPKMPNSYVSTKLSVRLFKTYLKEM